MTTQQLTSFGPAIDHLKTNAGTVTRMGWDGDFLAIEPVDIENESALMTMPYIFITYANGLRVPWMPTHADLLADDWVVL